jgi:hypothetical protein
MKTSSRETSPSMPEPSVGYVSGVAPDDRDAPTLQRQRNSQSAEFSAVKSTLFIAVVFSVCVSPNKAPEPTTRSVTPRAFLRPSEMKPRTPNRHAARGAPERVVAHL